MKRENARDEIKRHIACTDYLEKSKNNMYCCPLQDCKSGHGQNGTGAVKYYQDTNTWHCHACDRGGDVIDLYMLQTGTDYSTALHELAGKIGITIDGRQPAATEFSDSATGRPQSDFNSQKDKYHGDDIKTAQSDAQSLDFTAYYKACQDRLNDPAAIAYLEARGISPETMSRFNVGFDPAADPATAPGAMADEYKAHPAPRLIVPCTNDFYIARSIDPSTPAAFKAPNPKGTHAQIFNTRGLYDGAEVIFVTEGIFDALSFIEAGQAAIATNGKGNGKLLVKRLQEQGTEAAFVIVPDNDDDPKTAEQTKRQAEELQSNLRRMNYKSIIYNIAGTYHDANDAFIADRPAFERNIAAAIREINRDEIDEFLEKIQTEAYRPYQTGLGFFDELLSGGVIPQTLLLLQAAPATGKTTLCQQIAETLAEHCNPVVYINLEMSREQMLAKAISAKLHKQGTYKTMTQILQGYTWTLDEKAVIEKTIKEYQATNGRFIKYNPGNIGTSIENINAHLKTIGEAARAKGKPAPVIVLDYLHLVTSDNKTDPGEIVKETVKTLKDYAKDYNTFVIGIVATNRDSNKAGRITLESGRDSSAIEYTADYQLSLNYEAIDKGEVKTTDLDGIARLQEEPMRQMIIRVNKSRFTMPGKKALVMFDAAHNTFYGTAAEFR